MHTSMNSHYASVTVIGPRRDAIEVWLRSSRRRAWLAPTQQRLTTVFDAECDTLSTTAIEDFVIEISGDLACTAFAVLNDGDDLFMYWLAEDGTLQDSYLNGTGVKGGNARRLAHSLGGNRDAIDAVLHRELRSTRAPHLRVVGDRRPSTDVHRDLLRAVGMPDTYVGLSWTELERSETRPGMARIGGSDRGRLPEYLRLV